MKFKYELTPLRIFLLAIFSLFAVAILHGKILAFPCLLMIGTYLIIDYQNKRSL